MPGLYDYPNSLPQDRVDAVTDVLGFLALAVELLEDHGNSTAAAKGDLSGLAILLRECSLTLKDIVKK